MHNYGDPAPYRQIQLDLPIFMQWQFGAQQHQIKLIPTNNSGFMFLNLPALVYRYRLIWLCWNLIQCSYFDTEKRMEKQIEAMEGRYAKPMLFNVT